MGVPPWASGVPPAASDPVAVGVRRPAGGVGSRCRGRPASRRRRRVPADGATEANYLSVWRWPIIPPEPTPEDRAARYRRLIALEISRIIEDLALRRPLLLDVWSRHRDRGPFLDTIHSRWGTLGFPELAILEPELLLLVESFYRDLHDFRLYVSYTQDMPSTLAERYDFVRARLERVGLPALEALGGIPDRPIVASGGADPALVGALGTGPRENREGDPEYFPPSGVLYEELATAASAIAAERGEHPPGLAPTLGPSPAALAETEEERAARTNWRRNGKVFLPSSGDDGEA